MAELQPIHTFHADIVTPFLIDQPDRYNRLISLSLCSIIFLDFSYDYPIFVIAFENLISVIIANNQQEADTIF